MSCITPDLDCLFVCAKVELPGDQRRPALEESLLLLSAVTGFPGCDTARSDDDLAT